MSVMERGYLSLNIPGETYIEISIYAISLVLQCAINMLAISKIRRNQQISTLLTMCFAASSFFACVAAVSSILFHVDIFNDITHKIALFIWSLSVYWFFLSLLCTVILKLHVTFKSSSYRMSLTMICLFAMIVLLFVILSLVFSIFVYLFECSQSIRFPVLCFPVFFSGLVVYSLGCSLAVYAFVCRLLNLTKIQEISSRNLNVSPKNMQLKPQQQKLADLAMKSMILFAVQIASSILACILAFGFSRTLWDAFFAIDLTINYLCAYMQFAFATKHYRKCCGFCDDKFRAIMLERIKRKVSNHPSS